MPAKHVRFSRTNTVHSPPTPSFSLSSLSPASSSAPLTPPNHLYGLPGHSHYAIPYSQPAKLNYPLHLRLHPVLSHSHSPIIAFDMRDHPANITMHNRHLSTLALSELATDPPLPSLSISSPHLPWSITVRASRGLYVTLLDVLDGIYRTLRMNITPAEFAALPSEKDRRRATRAYEHRYRRLRSAKDYENEKRQGMKRIDFLMDMTQFTGLSTTNYGPGVLVLNFA